MPRPVEFDFTGAARGFEVLPEGKYLLQVDKVYDTDRDGDPLVSKKGNPQIRVRFRVAGAPPGLEETVGKPVTDFFTLTTGPVGALWRWREFLEAVTKRTLTTATFDLDKLEAAAPVVQAQLYNEVFEGVERTKIGKYEPAVASAPKPMPKPEPTPFPAEDDDGEIPDLI